jgi:hypothetical protein
MTGAPSARERDEARRSPFADAGRRDIDHEERPELQPLAQKRDRATCQLDVCQVAAHVASVDDDRRKGDVFELQLDLAPAARIEQSLRCPVAVVGGWWAGQLRFVTRPKLSNEKVSKAAIMTRPAPDKSRAASGSE